MFIMFPAFSSFPPVSMVLLFLNTVFSMLGTFFCCIIHLFLCTSACAFVLMIQALKIPGEVIQTGLQALGDAIKGCLKCLLNLLLQVLSDAVSSLFDLLWKRIAEGSSTTFITMEEVIANLRILSAELSKDLVQVFEGLQQMFCKIVEDLLKHYVDAVKYALQNA